MPLLAGGEDERHRKIASTRAISAVGGSEGCRPFGSILHEEPRRLPLAPVYHVSERIADSAGNQQCGERLLLYVLPYLFSRT